MKKDNNNDNTEHQQNNTALHAAVKNLDINQVILLLGQEGINVDAKDDKNRTPLHYAVQLGSVDIVNLLLAKEANTNVRDNEGNTPLHLGACQGDKSKAVSCLLKPRDLKLDDKVNIDVNNKFDITVLRKDIDAINKLDITSFGPGVNIDARNKLDITALDHGANVNARNKLDITPLHYAALYGNFKVVSLLLSRKANMHARDKQGKTPFQYAEASGAKGVCTLLNKHWEKEYPEYKKLINCIEKGNTKSLIKFLERNDKNCQLLEIVDEDTKLASIHVLAKDKINGIDMLDELLCNNKRKDTVRLLLDQADETDNGFMPLHHAVTARNPEMVEWLIKLGADINAQDKAGNTALHLAVNAGYKNILSILNKYGASTNIENNNGETPVKMERFILKINQNILSERRSEFKAAVAQGDCKKVANLLNKNPRFLIDYPKKTLELAGQSKQPVMFKLLADRLGEKAKPLIKQCINKQYITTVGLFSHYLVHCIDCKKQSELVQWYKKHGADFNISSSSSGYKFFSSAVTYIKDICTIPSYSPSEPDENNNNNAGKNVFN